MCARRSSRPSMPATSCGERACSTCMPGPGRWGSRPRAGVPATSILSSAGPRRPRCAAATRRSCARRWRATSRSMFMPSRCRDSWMVRPPGTGTSYSSTRPMTWARTSWRPCSRRWLYVSRRERASWSSAARGRLSRRCPTRSRSNVARITAKRRCGGSGPSKNRHDDAAGSRPSGGSDPAVSGRRRESALRATPRAVGVPAVRIDVGAVEAHAVARQHPADDGEALGDGILCRERREK